MTTAPPSVETSPVAAAAPPVFSCRFYVAGVAVRVLFSPTANLANIRETLPRPDGLEIVMPCEEPGDGAFQIQLRPIENLRERPEVAGNGHPQ